MVWENIQFCYNFWVSFEDVVDIINMFLPNGFSRVYLATVVAHSDDDTFESRAFLVNLQ